MKAHLDEYGIQRLKTFSCNIMSHFNCLLVFDLLKHVTVEVLIKKKKTNKPEPKTKLIRKTAK